MISQGACLSCKTVYRWVRTDSCFISDKAVLSLSLSLSLSLYKSEQWGTLSLFPPFLNSAIG